MDFNNNYS